MKSIQRLREERAEVAKQLLALHEDTANWTPENREASQAKYDELTAQYDNLQADIDRTEKVQTVQNAQTARVIQAAERAGISVDQAVDNAERDRAIVNTWLRRGVRGLTAEQREYMETRHRSAEPLNTMSIGSDSEGGYTIAEGFGGRLLEEMKAFGGVRPAATVITTQKGNPIPWPTVDDTAISGELLSDVTTATDQDFAFGVRQLDGYVYSSKVVPVPVDLLEDAGIDMEGFIARALAIRLGRVTETAYTTGNGSSKPHGLVTNAALGVTGAGGQLTGFIYDDLVNLEHSVDPAYRTMPGTGFMFNDTTLRELKKLLDGTGRPVWLPSTSGIAGNFPATLMGYPYFINQAMASPAANAKSMLFGALKNYVIRDTVGFELYRFTDSAYMKKRMVGFLAFMRTDGELMDVQGYSVRYFVHAAS